MATNIQNLQGEIRHQLKALGYHNIEVTNKYEKGFDVIAEGTLRNIFLSVIIILVSEHFSKLSREKIKDIKRKANDLHKEPWSAVMSVNKNGELTDRIQWINISKCPA